MGEPMQVRGPNAWVAAAFAAALGASIGGGTAALEATMRPWRVGDFGPGMLQTPAADTPRADVPETTHAFGTIGAGQEGAHEFVIRNAGAAPLSITKGATSCSCTVSDFDTADGAADGAVKVVEPGGETRVRLKWRGKGSGGPFRQQATVFTNDPRRPEIAFVIEGTVVPTWKAFPESIVLSQLSAGAASRATARIFTFGTKPPEVGSLAVADPQASQFFSLSTEPLAAAEIAAEPGATGGFVLSVDVKPGLPIGPLRHSIVINVRIPEDVVAEVPLEGSVVGDLALAGSAWDSSRQSLLLGTVSGKVGSHAQVFLTAKGPYRATIKPVVREVVPGSLQVDVGEGKPVGSGGVIRIPISITIPPGSQPANHRCSQQAPAGRIVLETGHPDSPTLTIPVCIAIGP
ncbi:MAG: DUF1573 domain-containing protein [Planctomycetia bacterium]